MATFAQLKTRVNTRLGLDTTSNSVDDVSLGYYLNDAVRDFLLRTKCNVDRGEITISGETDDAELSTGVLAVQEIHITSDSRVITPIKVSPQTILDYRRASASPSQSPFAYALQGNDLFMFYPALSDGTLVTIYYVPRPTEMSGSVDPSVDPYGGIPIEFHPALEMYAAWQMADVDDDASSQMGLSYQRQYLLLCKDAQRAIRHKGGRSLGQAQVGRRRPFRYSRSQDLY